MSQRYLYPRHALVRWAEAPDRPWRIVAYRRTVFHVNAPVVTYALLPADNAPLALRWACEADVTLWEDTPCLT